MSTSGRSGTITRSHPYRLEVQDVTPVSASLLWSLRPPPLSAIPRNLLKKQNKAIQRHHQANSSHASSTSTSSQPSKLLTVNRLANESGVTATRSVNRKVTNVTVRNISPNKQSRLSKQNQAHLQGVDSEDWPSDDGATVVDEEEEVREEEEGDHDNLLEEDASRLHRDDYSEASDDGTASAKIFDSGVSVCVNGVPWSQVMMGDRGVDEAFMVVYGLSPSREYELLLSVEGNHSATISLSTTAEQEEQGTVTNAIPSPTTSTFEQGKNVTSVTNQAPVLARLRTHTPPMQDTEASPIEIPIEQLNPPLSAASSVPASPIPTSSSTLQASIRRARKDASRAETALRNEIEAIKRGLERMSDVDHRSKQKVLALQESIRQANLHAKDIDEEANVVESERGIWEEKEREKEKELEKVKSVAEESLRQGDAQTKQDDEEVEAVEKELQKLTRILEEKWMAKVKIEKEKVTEMEQELERVQLEIDSLLRPQLFPQNQYYFNTSPVPAQGKATASFVPSLVSNRAKGRGGASRGGSRSTSSPTAINANMTPRRNFNSRAKGQVQQSSSIGDESLLEIHGSSSSSTHGSTLNPHNPEFVPANVSSIFAKSSTVSHLEYSPSTASRFTFPSNALYSKDHDTSPRPSSSLTAAAPTTPWVVGSNNATTNLSLWSTNAVNQSPTLSHDIWGASAANPPPPPPPPPPPSTSSASHHSPSLSVNNKTSIPFGLNSFHHRNQAYFSNSPGEEIHPTSLFSIAQEEEFSAGRRRGSAPVSPGFPPA